LEEKERFITEQEMTEETEILNSIDESPAKDGEKRKRLDQNRITDILLRSSEGEKALKRREEGTNRN